MQRFRMFTKRGGFTIEAGTVSNGCIVLQSSITDPSDPNYPESAVFNRIRDLLNSTKPLNVNGVKVRGILRVVP